MFRGNTKRRSARCLVLFLILGILSVFRQDDLPIQAQAKTTHTLHKAVTIKKNETFSKDYAYTLSKPGYIKVKIKIKGVNALSRAVLYNHTEEFRATGDNSLKLILSPDRRGNASGTLKTDHILYSGKYYIRLELLSPAQRKGSATLDISQTYYKIADNESAGKVLNEDQYTARTIKLDGKQSNRYLLSGYREQNNPMDYYKFTIPHTGKYSFRIKSIMNKKNLPVYATLISDQTGQDIEKLGPAGSKLKVLSVELNPGAYYLRISSPKSSMLDNAQVVYSLSATPVKPVSSIHMKKKITMYSFSPYKTVKLHVTPDYGKLSSDFYVLKSSNPSVATVNASGKITAKKPGKTRITCYYIDNPAVKSVCSVTVKKPSLKISRQQKTIYLGKPTKLTVKKVPEKQTIRWISSNPGIASVSPNGIVKGLCVGKAFIYVKSKEGGRSSKCNVTIRKKVPVKKDPTTNETNDQSSRQPSPDPRPLQLILSSAHLTPKGDITVKANIPGGNFSCTGPIAIISSTDASCVIRPTLNRGEATITYTYQERTISKHLVIY